MTENERREAARKFSNRWAGKGDEKQDSQKFWTDLLMNVFEIENINEYVEFEKTVYVNGSQKYIDVYLPKVSVLIEQKSLKKDLLKAEHHSGGILLTPYEQAVQYDNALPQNEKAAYIITCNFSEFHIYDMNDKGKTLKYETIYLSDLQDHFHRLDILKQKENVKISEEEEVSKQAGDIIGEIYDEFIRECGDEKETLHLINVLLVRLVFCFFAEDSGIFSYNQFHNYLSGYKTEHMQIALRELFRILDTPYNKRGKFLEPKLAEFPYVNGGLFSEEIDIPPFTNKIRTLILKNASEDFNWSKISPTIFGAIFESTLNQETRRNNGMHYTSVENIHKVIDPLFMDGLKREYKSAIETKDKSWRTRRLTALWEKIAGLKFFDPACGSGNFLTESYISLRKLENKIIFYLDKEQTENQITMDFVSKQYFGVKVSITQFYGIEINDFAVAVAKTALWIAEAQMLALTKRSSNITDDYLPLVTNANIVQGNALTTKWESIVSHNEINYIMGNPPFVGARIMDQSQKKELNEVFSGWKNVGNLDYVSAWYKLTVDYIRGTNIRAALVSTNSVVQGETVGILWKPLFEKGVHFDFAYKTFKWDSEAKIKAHVHCVIIGFSTAINNEKKMIFEDDQLRFASNINGYLFDAPDVFIEKRTYSDPKAPNIHYGSFALDDNNFTISEEEYKDLAKKDPKALDFLRPFIGAKEFLHGKKRYCVWLKDASPAEIKKSKTIVKKVEAVQEWRSKSNRKTTKDLAETPTLFAEIRQPNTKYLAIPTVCSEKRRYIPMAYLSPDVIASNQLYIVENADLYHFGILSSNVHNSWMRAICGRLKSDYRYSNSVVYNNFPWPSPTDSQRKQIEHTAQGILDARAMYPDSNLAELYDRKLMPAELTKAHHLNNIAVMKAYGFDPGKMSELNCVEALMEMYKERSK